MSTAAIRRTKRNKTAAAINETKPSSAAMPNHSAGDAALLRRRIHQTPNHQAAVTMEVGMMSPQYAAAGT